MSNAEEFLSKVGSMSNAFHSSSAPAKSVRWMCIDEETVLVIVMHDGSEITIDNGEAYVSKEAS